MLSATPLTVTIDTSARAHTCTDVKGVKAVTLRHCIYMLKSVQGVQGVTIDTRQTNVKGVTLRH